MPFEDADLIAEFVIESNEHLADVENQLLAIEAGGADVDADLVNTVFRAVHSVKGAAGFLGLETISRLAHSLENVLNKIRGGEMAPTSESTDVMLRSADTLRTLINEWTTSNDFDQTSLIKELDLVEKGTYESVAPSTSQPEPSSEQEAEIAPRSVEAEPRSESQTTDAGATHSKSNAPQTVAEESTPAGANPVASAAKTESSIRVNVHVLDQLMNLAGELVLRRNQMLQSVSDPHHAGLEAAANGLDHVTSELQEAIMQTRMQPIGNVFGKFPRIVRDLSSKLGKQCSLDVKGKEVEVDKTIIEAIGDPLTHLIRNSVDHGVEAPEDRLAAGKAAAGSVQLRAFHQAGKVCLEIVDDGAGINPQKLKDKAVAKGIVSTDRASQMSDRDAVRLIFHPGFSTAEKVSDVSGRGVGMDVVRTNIERLGGTVDIDSQVGVGTTIRVTLPLTLAIIPSMVVTSRQERFAIPQANIVELVRLRHSELASRIASVKSGEVLRLRGSLLPLVRLTNALAMDADGDEADASHPMSIVIVETGQSKYGLVVDGIADSEEIVVKPLGRHVKNCGYLAGATILGDGRVALILDVAGLAAMSGVHTVEESEASERTEIASSTVDADSHRLLLFESDPSDRFAVPMEVVARIEHVRTDLIDSVGGRELLQYRGVPLPLVSVEDALDVNSRPDYDHVFIIVFTAGSREIGLVAPKLHDIREVSAVVDESTFRVPGVVGSVFVDDRLTRLVDVFELAETVHPAWFASNQPDDEGEASPLRILLAEDSTFFRNQVARFLREAQFDVTEAADGQEAWEALQEPDADYQLVITDIEMPNMDGFELCRRIRQDFVRTNIPIMALTSLSSEAHLRRGQDVGFNDYQVKMHRDNLLSAVQRLSEIGRELEQEVESVVRACEGAIQ